MAENDSNKDVGFADTTTQLSVEGLKAPAEIRVDHWGVPHIRAANLDDLFFTQGFNAARDRLWQIDLARKRGLGLIAADLGPGFLAQDRAARLFLYRGDMEAEWASYASDAKSICASFASGINAYIDVVGREPWRLPPEFVELGTRPAKWAAEDVVTIRTHALLRNAQSEVLRARAMAKADAEADLLRKDLEPLIRPHVAEGLDLGSIPLELLDVYNLATAPVMLSPERLACKLEDADRWCKVRPAGDILFDDSAHASNNWTIGPGRTVTGRPILANDPHRPYTAPSLRYLVHLTAPGFDAIGAGEALLPGIALGHNGHAAFGITLFFGNDEEDVYIYETRPGRPDEYRYKGSWEKMEIVRETFAVRGAPDQVLMMKFTRHGPVVYEEPGACRAYAIRTVISAPGTTPYGACLTSMRTRTFDDFRASMRRWGMPSVNQVYADCGGTIGWVVAGFNPSRKNWDGLLPVPGDGRYEWDGFVDADDLPWVKNPARGHFATANEMNWPRDWNRAKIPAYEWHDNSRATRIHQVLDGQPRHSLADSQALQTDVVSIPAMRLKALIGGLESGDADARQALAPLWAKGENFPMLYSRAAVDQATDARIELRPALQ